MNMEQDFLKKYNEKVTCGFTLQNMKLNNKAMYAYSKE